MKRDYTDEPSAEIHFELKDGETLIALGKPNCKGNGVEMFEFFIYSYDEYVKLGRPDDLPAAFYLPDSDLSAKLEGGFLYVYRDNKLLFVINRHNIKKIKTGINDYLVDFMEIK